MEGFEVPGDGGARRYKSAEHFIMEAKAQLFGDARRAKLIRAAAEPAEAKRIGRQVSGFDESTWASQREAVARKALSAKFCVGSEAHVALMATGDRALAEASSKDTVWGIGLSCEQARDGLPWRGQSHGGQGLLGATLEWVRARLREGGDDFAAAAEAGAAAASEIVSGNVVKAAAVAFDAGRASAKGGKGGLQFRHGASANGRGSSCGVRHVTVDLIGVPWTKCAGEAELAVALGSAVAKQSTLDSSDSAGRTVGDAWMAGAMCVWEGEARADGWRTPSKREEDVSVDVEQEIVVITDGAGFAAETRAVRVTGWVGDCMVSVVARVAVHATSDARRARLKSVAEWWLLEAWGRFGRDKAAGGISLDQREDERRWLLPRQRRVPPCLEAVLGDGARARAVIVPFGEAGPSKVYVLTNSDAGQLEWRSAGNVEPDELLREWAAQPAVREHGLAVDTEFRSISAARRGDLAHAALTVQMAPMVACGAAEEGWAPLMLQCEKLMENGLLPAANAVVPAALREVLVSNRKAGSIADDAGKLAALLSWGGDTAAYAETLEQLKDSEWIDGGAARRTLWPAVRASLGSAVLGVGGKVAPLKDAAHLTRGRWDVPLREQQHGIEMAVYAVSDAELTGALEAATRARGDGKEERKAWERLEYADGDDALRQLVRAARATGRRAAAVNEAARWKKRRDAVLKAAEEARAARERLAVDKSADVDWRQRKDELGRKLVAADDTRLSRREFRACSAIIDFGQLTAIELQEQWATAIYEGRGLCVEALRARCEGAKDELKKEMRAQREKGRKLGERLSVEPQPKRSAQQLEEWDKLFDSKADSGASEDMPFARLEGPQNQHDACPSRWMLWGKDVTPMMEKHGRLEAALLQHVWMPHADETSPDEPNTKSKPAWEARAKAGFEAGLRPTQKLPSRVEQTAGRGYRWDVAAGAEIHDELHIANYSCADPLASAHEHCVYIVAGIEETFVLAYARGSLTSRAKLVRVISPEGLVLIEKEGAKDGEEPVMKERYVNATNVSGLKAKLRNTGAQLAQKRDMMRVAMAANKALVDDSWKDFYTHLTDPEFRVFQGVRLVDGRHARNRVLQMGGRQSVSVSQDVNVEFARVAGEAAQIEGLAALDARGLDGCYEHRFDLSPLGPGESDVCRRALRTAGDLELLAGGREAQALRRWRAPTVAPGHARLTPFVYIDDSNTLGEGGARADGRGETTVEEVLQRCADLRTELALELGVHLSVGKRQGGRGGTAQPEFTGARWDFERGKQLAATERAAGRPEAECEELEPLVAVELIEKKAAKYRATGEAIWGVAGERDDKKLGGTVAQLESHVGQMQWAAGHARWHTAFMEPFRDVGRLAAAARQQAVLDGHKAPREAWVDVPVELAWGWDEFFAPLLRGDWANELGGLLTSWSVRGGGRVELAVSADRAYRVGRATVNLPGQTVGSGTAAAIERVTGVIRDLGGAVRGRLVCVLLKDKQAHAALQYGHTAKEPEVRRALIELGKLCLERRCEPTFTLVPAANWERQRAWPELDGRGFPLCVSRSDDFRFQLVEELELAEAPYGIADVNGNRGFSVDLACDGVVASAQHLVAVGGRVLTFSRLNPFESNVALLRGLTVFGNIDAADTRTALGRLWEVAAETRITLVVAVPEGVQVMGAFDQSRDEAKANKFGQSEAWWYRYVCPARFHVRWVLKPQDQMAKRAFVRLSASAAGAQLSKPVVLSRTMAVLVTPSEESRVWAAERRWERAAGGGGVALSVAEEVGVQQVERDGNCLFRCFAGAFGQGENEFAEWRERSATIISSWQDGAREAARLRSGGWGGGAALVALAFALEARVEVLEVGPLGERGWALDADVNGKGRTVGLLYESGVHFDLRRGGWGERQWRAPTCLAAVIGGGATPSVGDKVARRFGTQLHKGTIVGFDAVKRWFSVTYEDGDGEELNEKEAAAAKARRVKADALSDRGEGEQESKENGETGVEARAAVAGATAPLRGAQPGTAAAPTLGVCGGCQGQRGRLEGPLDVVICGKCARGFHRTCLGLEPGSKGLPLGWVSRCVGCACYSLPRSGPEARARARQGIRDEARHLEDGSQGNQRSALSVFVEFGATLGFGAWECLPANGGLNSALVEQFKLARAATGGVKVGSYANTNSALNRWCEVRSLEPPRAEAGAKERERGRVKRMGDEGRSVVVPKRPMTFELQRACVEYWKKKEKEAIRRGQRRSWVRYRAARNAFMFDFGFFGIRRVGDARWVKRQHIVRVKPCNEHNGGTEIFMPGTKTDVFKRGAGHMFADRTESGAVLADTIGGFGAVLDELGWGAADPATVDGSGGRPLGGEKKAFKNSKWMARVVDQTVAVVIASAGDAEWVRAEKAWQSENVGTKRGGHSLRRGGRNHARRRQKTRAEVDAVGNWRSEAGGAYDEWTNGERLGFSGGL
jgi:ribA/ribD-fused uncharacterized protein